MWCHHSSCGGRPPRRGRTRCTRRPPRRLKPSGRRRPLVRQRRRVPAGPTSSRPAFVVRTTTPAELKSPTASQVAAEGQARPQTWLTPTNDAICAHECPPSAASSCAASALGRHTPPTSAIEAKPAMTLPAILPRRSRSSGAGEPARPTLLCQRTLLPPGSRFSLPDNGGVSVPGFPVEATMNRPRDASRCSLEAAVNALLGAPA